MAAGAQAQPKEPLAGDERDLELEQLKQQVGEQIKKVDLLQQALQDSRRPSQPQVQSRPSGPAVTKEDLEKQFWQNPLDMTAAIAQKAAHEAATAAYQAATAQGAPALDTLVEVAKGKARELAAAKGDGEIFDKFLPDIEAKVGMVQPQFRTNVNVWINAWNNTVGENMEEIFKMRNARSGAPAVKTSEGGPAAPSSKQPPAPRKEQLNDDERRIAQKLRLSDDEYLRGKERYARQDQYKASSWDEVVTFDSSRRRTCDIPVKK